MEVGGAMDCWRETKDGSSKWFDRSGCNWQLAVGRRCKEEEDGWCGDQWVVGKGKGWIKEVKVEFYIFDFSIFF